jgi:hypothetical protein
MKRTRFLLLPALMMLPLLASGYDAGQAAADLAGADRVADAVPWSELLGPLAPVALSPFFGLACLSGLSLLVTRGVLPENAFLHGHPVLTHPAVFIAFLALALFTSLPRLTKVSKPLALLCDTMETYAGIVAVIVVQAVTRHLGAAEPDPVVLPAGLGTITWSALLAGLSLANILVIQTVRLFFELLVWISPLPLLDAAFEAMNKVVCAALLALYAFSPWAALLFNTLIFLVCLALFRRARRGIRGLMERLRLAGRWLRETLGRRRAVSGPGPG